MRNFFRAFILCALCLSISSFARPKVGLVLSGGGAKGIVHVGVLKWIEQHRIPIDYITGTSIGAYVGGMYALGYSSSEIESVMLNLDWNAGYKDSVARADLPLRAKQIRDNYNIPIDMGFQDGKVKLAPGLLQGQAMLNLLHQSVGYLPYFDDFSKLPIPFQAVAANLETRKVHVFDRGDFVEALRASMSVPGILAPIEKDGKYFVDGGIVNNLPVDVARDMGADIIIAVNIGAYPMTKEKLASPIRALEQMSIFLVNKNINKSIASLKDTDVLISPDIQHIPTTGFVAITSENIQLGYDTAAVQEKKLLSMQLSEADFFLYQERKFQKRDEIQADLRLPIRDVHILNKDLALTPLIESQVDVADIPSAKDKFLYDSVHNIYNLDKFEKVDAYYKIDKKKKVKDIYISVNKKSWGPNFLYYGLAFEKSANTLTSVELSLALLMTELNDDQAELDLFLQLGPELLLKSYFYQPLNLKDRYYAFAELMYVNHEDDAYDNLTRIYYDSGNQFWEGGFGVGSNASHNLGFYVGVKTRQFGMNRQEFRGSTYDISYSSFSSYSELQYDTLDNKLFPTRGNYLSLSGRLVSQEQKKQRIYDVDGHKELMYITSPEPLNLFIYEAKYLGVLDIRDHIFSTRLEYGKVQHLNELEADVLNLSMYDFQLGGFLSLSGLHRDALKGNEKIFGSAIYRYQISPDFLGMPNSPMYLGTSFEAGNVWHQVYGNSFTDAQTKVDFTDLILATSIFLGADTKIGHIAFALGYASINELGFYFLLGKSF